MNKEEIKISPRQIAKAIDDLLNENEQLKEDNILIKSANKLVSDKLKDYKLRYDKATNYYYKTLAEYEKENKQMPEESVMIFNLMEGNK